MQRGGSRISHQSGMRTALAGPERTETNIGSEHAAAEARVAISQSLRVRHRRSGYRKPNQLLPIADYDPGEPVNADSFRHAQPLPFDIGESLAVPRPKDTHDFYSGVSYHSAIG